MTDNMLQSLSNCNIQVLNDDPSPNYFIKDPFDSIICQKLQLQGDPPEVFTQPQENKNHREIDVSKMFLDYNYQDNRWLFEFGQKGDEKEENYVKNNIKKNIKNQTKNIAKNFGKAIINFIERQQNLTRSITKQYEVNYNQFMKSLKLHKKGLNTIADLRTLWSDYKFERVMRVLSNIFLRRHSLRYIFNSRIMNHSTHIKYRNRLLEAIMTPLCFKHIKQY